MCPRGALGCVLVALACASVGRADKPFFRGLGDLPGGGVDSTGRAISRDATTVVGYSVSDRSGWSGESMFWTDQDGMVALGNFPGEESYESEALDVAAEGSVIVGVGSLNGHGEAYRWMANDGMVPLGTLGGREKHSNATGVSISPDVVVGSSFSKRSGKNLEAFRWTPDEGMVPLVEEFDPDLFPWGAADLSADGSVIVGTAAVDRWYSRAYRWTREEGMVLLGELCESCDNGAVAVSADGKVIVGTTYIDDEQQGLIWVPFRWTEEDGIVPLGQYGTDNPTHALDVSNDGETIVGGTGSSHAIIWDREHGVRLLKAVLEDDYGLNLTGWYLAQAYGVSGDGRTITGWGANPDGDGEASIAHIGKLGPGDVNCDHDVNFDDIDPFVLALTDPDEYENQYGETCDLKYADINADGNVDFDDIDPFVECLINNGWP